MQARDCGHQGFPRIRGRTTGAAAFPYYLEFRLPWFKRKAAGYD